MGAAAFFAAQGRARDEAGDGDQGPLTARVGRRRVGQRRSVERVDGVGEAFARAEQSGIAPHQIADVCRSAEASRSISGWAVRLFASRWTARLSPSVSGHDTI